MRYFFDSSALVKLFLNEPESAAMARLVESVPVERLLCSRLALLEIRSAIQRKLIYRQITPASALQATGHLIREMSRWTVLPITEQTLEQASSVIEAYGLRALDALQLGTALLADSSRTELTLVVYDRRFADAARTSGLPALSPE